MFEFDTLLFKIVDLHLVELLELTESGEFIFRCFVGCGCLDLLLDDTPASASFTSVSKSFLSPW